MMKVQAQTSYGPAVQVEVHSDDTFSSLRTSLSQVCPSNPFSFFCFSLSSPSPSFSLPSLPCLHLLCINFYKKVTQIPSELLRIIHKGKLVVPGIRVADMGLQEGGKREGERDGEE